jgi:hypothetical protein
MSSRRRQQREREGQVARHAVNVPSKDAGARGRALGQAVLALMEPAVSRRMGLGDEISRSGYARLEAAKAAGASSPAELDDFMEQASTLAWEAVEQHWGRLAPLVRQDGRAPQFLDLADWPAELVGQPLHPFPPAAEVSAQVSSYGVEVRHRVAHGIVGAALSGRAVSVGFAGFRIPGTLAPEVRAPILIAGAAAAALLTGALDADRGCECGPMLVDAIAAIVGARPEARPAGRSPRALGEQLNE